MVMRGSAAGECLGLPAAARAFAALEYPDHIERLLPCQGVYCDGG